MANIVQFVRGPDSGSCHLARFFSPEAAALFEARFRFLVQFCVSTVPDMLTFTTIVGKKSLTAASASGCRRQALPFCQALLTC